MSVAARGEEQGDHASALLVWDTVSVAGRPAHYGAAGDGPAVVFLHGWALTNRTYKRALRRLVERGLRVLAPSLPGFGGTAELGGRDFSFAGYAAWLVAFLDALDVREPVVLMGHSFGGGVAIQAAHDHPGRVRSLVLINSIGGSAWAHTHSGVRSMAERPLWDWGIHFPRDLLPFPQVRRVLPVVLQDAVPNLLRNPRALWRAADLARRADLTPELEELKERGLPVVVLWGEQDRIVTRASHEALCVALGGPETVTVPGRHSWMLADPDAFGEIITNVVDVAARARKVEEAEEMFGGHRRRRPARELRTLRRARPSDQR